MAQAVQNPSPAQEQFRTLCDQWKVKSRHMSNSVQMAMLKPYQQILGMGRDALPHIFEELAREPDHWFWALESITRENPVPPEAVGKVRQMADAWIAWAKQHGYLAA